MHARLVGAILLLGVAWPGDGRAWLRPITAEQRRLLEQVPDEQPYRVRTHFLTSNEKRHDVFYPILTGLGGIYIGVGADQNYTLAAMARADLLWTVDIDEQVVQWHRIYAALLPRAPSPQDLLRLLEGRRPAEVRRALDERWGVAAPDLWRAYRRDRERIAGHVRSEIARGRGGLSPGWLGDLTLYDHVRALARDRRILPHVADVNGHLALPAMADAARAAGLPVRVFYISNVEQWFRYKPQLARNLAALPHDGRSVILRTLARRELRWPTGDRWHFSVQPLEDFVRRLGGPSPPIRVHDLMGDMKRADWAGAIPGMSVIGTPRLRPRPVPGRWTPPVRGPEEQPVLLAERPSRPSWASVQAPF